MQPGGCCISWRHFLYFNAFRFGFESSLLFSNSAEIILNTNIVFFSFLAQQGDLEREQSHYFHPLLIILYIFQSVPNSIFFWRTCKIRFINLVYRSKELLFWGGTPRQVRTIHTIQRRNPWSYASPYNRGIAHITFVVNSNAKVQQYNAIELNTIFIIFFKLLSIFTKLSQKRRPRFKTQNQSR